MSAALWEQYASRQGTDGRSPGQRRMYLIAGVMDEADVYATLSNGAFVMEDGVLTFEEGAPFTIKDPAALLENGGAGGSLYAVAVSINPVGGGVWTCSVDYGLTPRITKVNPGDTTTNIETTAAGDVVPAYARFRCTGVNQHITQALYTSAQAIRTADSGAGKPVPDFKGAIGVSKTGVQGCDVPVPQSTWQENWNFLAKYCTWAQMKIWDDMVGRCNKQTFRSRPAGSVRLEDYESDPFGNNQQNVVFSFKYEPNITAFRLTPDFDPVDKEGFEYLWVSYAQSTDANNIFMVPVCVTVNRVGRPGLTDDAGKPTNKDDFLKLGIGL